MKVVLMHWEHFLNAKVIPFRFMSRAQVVFSKLARANCFVKCDACALLYCLHVPSRDTSFSAAIRRAKSNGAHHNMHPPLGVWNWWTTTRSGARTFILVRFV